MFSATQDRKFKALADASAAVPFVVVYKGQLSDATFKLAIDSARSGNGLKLFSASQTFGAAAKSWYGYVGRIAGSDAGDLTVNPGRQAYFLFQFEDSGTVFNGWIDVNIRVFGPVHDNYIRINRYAWQSSTLGVLAAGATPVPEPSTVVTSSIAALAGGAAALRRWRKERRATNGAA